MENTITEPESEIGMENTAAEPESEIGIENSTTEPESEIAVETPTAERDRRMAQSPVMSRFYRALAILNSNAVFRVMKPNAVGGPIGRAHEETKSLIAAANSGGNHRCPSGQIWDEFAKRCVSL